MLSLLALRFLRSSLEIKVITPKGLGVDAQEFGVLEVKESKALEVEVVRCLA